MKKVIFIEQTKEETKKPVEFTHCLQYSDNSFYKGCYYPKEYKEVLHVGKHESKEFGMLDLFRATKESEVNHFFLGHLNSGEY